MPAHITLMPKLCGMSKYECDECGETFEKSADIGAHKRWEHTNPDEEADDDQDSKKKGDSVAKKIQNIDSDWLDKDIHRMEVKGENEGYYTCSECGADVRPGENCKACGAELNWKK